ncbi:TonB-dependent receptor [uncultured Pontibacter sp.]|uniref:SusC/RagA family TonB-linked outer membrane protein n=1 Tax=uncultured Pontibacter sp. TaxID=453356 RepID=UPI00263337EA|nr:TonB-dependent receptor [uncultured Pontibacter sp.]
MRKSVLLNMALLLVLVSQAWAQSRTVSGRVTDAKNGQALPGVNVVVKGTSTGTFTGVDGSYSLDMPGENATVVFSFLGYISQEINTAGKNTLNVSLTEDSKQLSEVVVVGYGVQDVKDVTGSITSISAAKIENQPVQSFDQALSGRAAGVQITNTSGLVADGVTVRIRGVGSISNSSQPLFVIDGVPMAQVSNLNSFNGGNGTRYNPLADLNPNDIASIEVLKDAAAAALYGSRAANGVVLVSTKRGKNGTAKITYDFYTGYNEAVNTPDLLNGDEFISITNEKAANAGKGAIAGNVDVNEDGIPDRTNWLDEIFRKGIMQNHQLSLSGGSEKATYYGSVSYTDQDGFVKANSLQRGSARLNFDITPKEWLRAGISTNFTKTINNGVLSNSYLAGITLSGYNAAPNLPVYGKDGFYYLNDQGYLGDGANRSDLYFLNRFYHPVGTLDLQRNQNISQRMLGNAYIEVEPVKNLKLTSKYGIDYINNFEDQYSDPNIQGLGWKYRYNGLVQTNDLRRNQWNWSNYASYSLLLADRHNVAATAGFEYQEVAQHYIGTYAGDFADPFFRDIITGTFVGQFAPDGGRTHNGFDSYFGRVSYDFGNKYYAEAAMRADAFSGFGQNNKRGYFPAGSVGWRISEESFMDRFAFLDDLKLRASYGIVGNSNIADFASRTLFGGGQYADLNGLSPTQVGNTNLKWESSTKLDIGMDMALLRDRVGFTFDYFHTDVTDLVLDAPVLRTTGIPGASVTTNIGSMYNKGIELSLTTTNIEKNGFVWTSNLNFSKIKNEITSLYNDVPVVSGSSEAAVGQAIGEFKLIRWAGVNPDNGNSMFLAKDGTTKQYDPATQKYYLMDGTETADITASDAVYVGNPYPKWFGGFDNTVTYKGFDLGVFFQYSGGNKILNQTRQGLMTNYLNNNLTEIKDRWQKPGDKTDVPKLYLQDNISTRTSTRWLEDGDFLRLRQISLGYNVPSSVLSRVGVSNLRVYGQVQNVFVLTKYTGADPEVNTNRDVNIAYGVDNRSVPQARSFTLGVSVGL